MAEDVFDIPYSVDIFLPPHYQRTLRELVNAGKAHADIEIMYGALWRMRDSEMTREAQRAELEAEIFAGMNSGPGIEVTPEFWEAFKPQCQARHAWLTALRHRGTIRNTLLPEKLYQYVQDKIASGAFATPTAVVCEALSKLEPFQRTSHLGTSGPGN